MVYLAAGEDYVEPEGLSVVLPPIYEIFWSAVVFIILWIVLGFALKVIYKKIDQRNEEIQAGLDAAEDAQHDAALAERKRKDLLREANEQAKQVRERATEDAGRIVSQAKIDAQTEAARITEAAHKQLASEREAAELSLRKDVGALATTLAEQIIGEKLSDDEVSARVVDRFMDELEASLQTQEAAAK